MVMVETDRLLFTDWMRVDRVIDLSHLLSWTEIHCRKTKDYIFVRSVYDFIFYACLLWISWLTNISKKEETLLGGWLETSATFETRSCFFFL